MLVVQLSKSKWILSLLIIVLFPFSKSYADSTAKRTLIIESMVEQDIQNKTLREKIITTRALGLYLQNLLPSKGNPYSHAYEYLNDLTLESFKEAQSDSASYMSQILWLPIDKNNRGELKNNKEKQKIINYFIHWMASIKALQFVNLYLKNSILVEPLDKTLPAEKIILFDKAYKLQEKMRGEYESRLLTELNFNDQFQEATNQIFIKISKRILQMMQPHLNLVKNKENSEAIELFVSEISKMEYSDLKSKITLQNQIKKIFDTKSPNFAKLEKALTSVDLPYSSDIDGTEESFEIVMRLEVGYGLLKNILLNAKSW